MGWLRANWPEVLVAMGQHVVLCLVSLAIAFALSLPVGIAAARNARAFRVAMAVTGTLYTIPTLAFLALLIPLVGLGATNAITCMVAFSLMILVRNIATGIRAVPGDVVDAARGAGMSRRDILVHVELPLAAPMIVAGLRIATVTAISVAVVAAYVNAGGLGTIVFAGISSDHAAKIWVGALAACLLAVTADWALAWAERALRARAG